MEADAHALLQVTGRSVRPTRRITVPSAEATGLSLNKTFNSAVYWVTDLSLDKTPTVPAIGHCLVVNEALSFAGSEY